MSRPALALALAFLGGAALGAPVPAFAQTPKAPAKPAPPPAAATGSITGTITFEGEAPERKQLVRDTDPYCLQRPKLAEDVIVTNGKVRDVLVRIKNGTAGKHAVPAQPIVLDQHECMYRPRVTGMIAGQKIVAKNSDGTFHNVHGTLNGKLLWNKPQAAQAPELTLEAAAKPGDVVEVVCDVHPWMRAYAVVHDHPYFAVTRDDGSFEIKGLPPGSYTLEAWHPKLGTQSVNVKIGAGAKANVTARLTYKP